MNGYPVILVDPPWSYRVWRRMASAHYDTQEDDWIASLPVATLATPDACLFLWVTFPKLPHALRVMEAWDFAYKTVAFTWVKATDSGTPRIGLGYWTRANAEVCLLGTRGRPKRLHKGVGQVIVSSLGEHSQKPDEQYERIERLVTGPYLELFHRPRHGILGPRPGWTFLGNEVDGLDICDAIMEITRGRCDAEEQHRVD